VRIETLCTGDELLTGLTADTNSRFFQTLLLERTGLVVRRSTVVGDVRAELIELLDLLSARCDVVLVSGGLGPTADDLTAESAAAAAGVPLVEDQAVLAHLTARFERRGITLTDNNRRQARVPAGAEVVLNDEGSAPLIIQRRGTCTLFFVPGVPKEHRFLVERHVVPRIAALAGPRRGVSKLRLIKTVGLPESHLDAKVQPLLAQHPQVTFGFRTLAPENHLKLMATGERSEEVDAALASAERAALGVLGEAVFGVDDQTLASALAARLTERGLTLSVAESCTGGLVSAACTEVPGASAWFIGGAATYSPAAKSVWAHVPAGLITQHGAVSEQVARAMADGVRTALGTSCGLSVTGFAGPGGGDTEHPVGTVFIGIATPELTRVERHRFSGDRERVRAFAAATAIDALRRQLGHLPSAG